MDVSRRDLLKLLAVAAGAGLAPRSLEGADGPARLLAFEPLGNVTLLHMTDPHATLLPVFYREPDTLIGIGAEKNQPPFVTGQPGSDDKFRQLLETGPDALVVVDRPGRIVLVSSSSGQIGEPLHIDYSATKGALISMAKGLSTELARDRIYVNCVAPGWVDTELVKSALNNSDKQRQVTKAIPLSGREGAWPGFCLSLATSVPRSRHDRES